MRPIRLTLRPLAASDAAAVTVHFEAQGLFLVPAEVGGHALVDALRAALSGHGALEAGGELALDFEVAGERFRAWRCWEVDRRAAKGDDGEPRPMLALLGRPTGDEITRMEVLAEGPQRVSQELQQIVGTTPGAAGVVVAPWSRLDHLVTGSPTAARGVAPGAFALLADEIEPVARAMGGRIRELLLAAHELLRSATEKLTPDQVDTLTPDDLVARREALSAQLEGAATSCARLVDAAVSARTLAAEVRRRKALVDGYFEADAQLRKLELRKGRVGADRSRLARARRAAQMAESMGLKARHSEPARVDPRVREQAEQALSRARAEAGEAAAALAAENGRAREREAIAEWIARLESYRPAYARVDEARATVDAVERTYSALETAALRARRELDAVGQRIGALETERLVLREGPAHVELMRQELRAAQRLSEDVRRLAAVRDRLRVEARELQNAKLHVDQATEAVEAAQAELDYRARSPIASKQEPTVTIPDLVARRDELQAAAIRQAEVLASVRDELRDLTTSLGAAAYKEPALLEAAAREKAEALEGWGAATRSLSELDAELAELSARGAALAREAETLAADLDREAMRRQQARSSLREREAAVPEKVRTRQDLEASIEMARADLAAREQALRAARERAKRSEDIVAACEAGLLAAQEAERGSRGTERRGDQLVRMRDGGFESWEDFESARLPDREMEQLEREIGEHDESVRAAEEQQRLGQDQAALPRQDPEQVELLAALVEDARDAAQAADGRLRQEIALIDGWLDGLDDISSTLSALEESAGFGHRGDAKAGASFEERVRESLMRSLLARAEGRLARWQRPWTLAWRDADADADRDLCVRDAESDAPIDLAGEGATLLALALALETAVFLSEKRRPRLETIVLDAVPTHLQEHVLDSAMAGLAEVARDHAVAVPADASMRDSLARRIPA